MSSLYYLKKKTHDRLFMNHLHKHKNTQKMCVKTAPCREIRFTGPLTTFRGPSVISSTPPLTPPVPAVIYIFYNVTAVTKIVCVCPERPEF